MKTYNRPSAIAKACKPNVSLLEPLKAQRQVKVFWKRSKSRKAFSETLRG